MTDQKSSSRIVLVIASIAALAASGGIWLRWQMPNAPNEQTIELTGDARLLKSLANGIGPTRKGDWLESHSEPGQSFQQYQRSNPVTLTSKRNVLYVQPIGEFSAQQQKIVRLSAEFLGIYFCCPVVTLDTLSTNETIPADARRVHPQWGVRQLKTTYILNDVLRPKLPDNAFAMIAFTTTDLYPSEKWNFVFGQASLRHRVGVWSIFRNGNPEVEFKKCLLRTLKTATHETGHMLSIQHCIAFDCNMCGSNNRAESDRRPLQLCPECVAKVWYSTNSDRTKRFQNLAKFCEQNELTEAGLYYQKATRLIQDAESNHR